MEEQLSCEDCSSACCNYVDIVVGGSLTRYCCGEHLPGGLLLKESAAILRLHLDESTSPLRGLHLDWQEGEDDDSQLF